jgi:glycosyltransferase involved in cell wall biosynthesis
MLYAFSINNITHQSQQKIVDEFKTPCVFLSIPALLKKSWRELWNVLRNKEVTICLIWLDSPECYLLSVLKLCVAATRAEHIYIMKNNQTYMLTQNRITLFIASALNSLYATVIAFGAYLKCFCSSLLLRKINIKKYNAVSADPILYLNTNLWFGVKAGGALTHAAGVIQGFTQQQFNICYAALEPNSLVNDTVTTIVLKPPARFSPWRELNYYQFNNKIIKQLKKLNTNFQFIYQRLSLGNFAGVILAKKFKIPLLIEYNGSEIWAAKHWGKALRMPKFARRCEDICFKHADMVVTVSDALKSELIARGVNAEKIVCYPNGVNPELFNPELFTAEDILQLRQQYQIHKDATIISFLGTFGVWHGIEILGSVIKILIEQEPAWLNQHKVHFLLIGDGLKLSSLQQLLNVVSAQKYVTFTGLISPHQVPSYLAACDIVVSPTLPNPDNTPFFGSPMKLFEYMIMGKAIIASRLGQIAEILNIHLSAKLPPLTNPTPENREVGLLCDPGKQQDLIQAIQFLVEQTEWRHKLGKNARQLALTKYTWQHHVAQILQKMQAKEGA